MWVLFLLRFSAGFFLLTQDSLIFSKVLDFSSFLGLSLYLFIELRCGVFYLASSLISDWRNIIIG